MKAEYIIGGIVVLALVAGGILAGNWQNVDVFGTQIFLVGECAGALSSQD